MLSLASKSRTTDLDERYSFRLVSFVTGQALGELLA